MSFARRALASTLVCLLPFAALAEDAAPASTPAATPAPAVTPAAADSKPITRAELPGLVKDTLLNDPDILMQAIQKLREKQTAEAKKQEEAGLVKRKADLFNDNFSPAIGSSNPDVTMVEFFDYHCGYCRHMLPVMAKYVADDKKVRIIFKEFPILSEDSVTAAKAALAVNVIAKDKYFDYHQALMQHSGKFDEASLLETAKKLGINPTKLKAEMDKPEITAQLDKNRDMAAELGIHGTPALVMGNELIPGAVDYDELKKMVDEARAKKTSSNDAPAQPKS